jgi:hypothetical protein
VTLGLPSVIGPLSEWLDSIPVEGCWPGATIVVQTNDAAATVVATGPSEGGRDLVRVVPGTQLKVGQRLVARQEFGGRSSDLTPTNLAVSVGASPTSHAQLPPTAFRSRLFSCGKAVWLNGAAPGAEVTVSVGGAVLAAGRADSKGNARLGLLAPLPPAGSTVNVQQAAPPGFLPLSGGPQIASAQTLPLPLGRLPKPAVIEPVPMGCESAVRIGSIVDGAEVTVTRKSDAWSQAATFDLSELWFVLAKAFPRSGDQISVSQAMPHCEVQPSAQAFADIKLAHAPDTPDIAVPCAGSNYLHIAKLRPGATLTVSVDGAEPLQYMVPLERTVWDVPVPRLPPGVKVKVRLNVCGFETDATVKVVDETLPPPPTLVEPLYGCGRAVSVETRVGTYLELWADVGAGPVQISERIHAPRDLATIEVFPFLTVPETVWAHQFGCRGAWLDSITASARPHPPLKPVELREPIEHEQAVLPTNAVSGAHVTVWASGKEYGGQTIIGERDVTSADPLVGLSRRLTTDDVIWAVQDMCDQRPEQKQRYNVTPGTVHFLLPVPIEQSSGQPGDGKIIFYSAEFACRFLDGSWIIYADIENTEPGYDCSIVLGISLDLTPPLAYGATLDADIAAKGGLPTGLAILGYPSHWTPSRKGTDKTIQNRAFWTQLLSASASWSEIVAWTNYAPVGEKPDWVKGPNAPPDPNQLWPPLPTEDDD